MELSCNTNLPQTFIHLWYIKPYTFSVRSVKLTNFTQMNTEIVLNFGHSCFRKVFSF
jgi:hypothetical protein